MTMIPLFTYGLGMMIESHATIKAMETKLIKEYRELQNLPRKLKKRKKKEILILWSANEHMKQFTGYDLLNED